MNTDIILSMISRMSDKIKADDFKKETTKKFLQIIQELSFAFRNEDNYANYIYSIGKIISKKIEDDNDFEQKVIEFMENTKKIL